MSLREAVRILMLSPLYFRMNTSQRWDLVREYRHNMEVAGEIAGWL